MSNWTLVGEVGFVVEPGAGNHSQALPGSPAEDDIVVIARYQAGGVQGAINTSGYTYLDGAWITAYKVMGGTPDTSVLLARHATFYNAHVLQVWRPAVAPGQAIDNGIASAFDFSPGPTDMPDPPAHTILTGGSLRIVTGHIDDFDTTVSGAPSGYSNLLGQNTGQSSETVGATVMIASKEAASPGSDDPGVFSGGGCNSEFWLSKHFALRVGMSAAGGSGILAGGI